MRGEVMDLPEMIAIGERYRKSPAQVVLRWDLQHGVATIPKSVKRDRIQSNAAIFDFELAPQDMAAIDALDRNHRLGPDPDSF